MGKGLAILTGTIVIFIALILTFAVIENVLEVSYQEPEFYFTSKVSNLHVIFYENTTDTRVVWDFSSSFLVLELMFGQYEVVSKQLLNISKVSTFKFNFTYEPNITVVVIFKYKYYYDEENKMAIDMWFELERTNLAIINAYKKIT